MSKTAIAKAILCADDEQPVQFGKHIETVTAQKMKEKLSVVVKDIESKLFKK
jgi:hypothetical protein